jgi:hypothetical protein
MNILLWYLPYAMFSGACDIALTQREAHPNDEWPAEPSKGMRDADNPAPAQSQA